MDLLIARSKTASSGFSNGTLQKEQMNIIRMLSTYFGVISLSVLSIVNEVRSQE